MSASTINLNMLLEKAITLARNDETLTIEQIIADILADDKALVDLPIISASTDKVSKRSKSAAPAKEVKTRTRTAPAKARSVPEDDVRCYARSFYENQHLEDGLLKVMRDDEANLYGDRCKFKKTGETDFCKHHAEKQALGVWNGEYAGKFKSAVEKTENGIVPEKKPRAKSPEKKKPESESDEYATEESEAEEPPKQKTTPAPAAEKPKSKPVAPKTEEPEDAEVEEVVIDDETYLIDTSDGTVYDYNTEAEVGRYNMKAKKWIVKPTA